MKLVKADLVASLQQSVVDIGMLPLEVQIGKAIPVHLGLLELYRLGVVGSLSRGAIGKSLPEPARTTQPGVAGSISSTPPPTVLLLMIFHEHRYSSPLQHKYTPVGLPGRIRSSRTCH